MTLSFKTDTYRAVIKTRLPTDDQDAGRIQWVVTNSKGERVAGGSSATYIKAIARAESVCGLFRGVAE